MTTTTRAGTAAPGHRRRWLLALIAVLAAAVGTWVVTGRGSEAPTADAGRSVTPILEITPADRGAPVELNGTTLEGDPLSLTSLRGSVVVINVWGSWCSPCRTEAPILAAAADTYSRQQVRFVGINTRDNLAGAQAFERRYGITYPSLDDSEGAAVLAFRSAIPLQAVPSTVILDRSGRIAARVVGEISEATLRALLDPVLAERPAS